MKMAFHPYKTKSAKSFWETAVSERSYLEFSNVYEKKFSIKPSDRVVTAGSCFAQHIAKRLRAHGFDYRDYEPPPYGLPEDRQQAFSYNVYSARYNNIYTARQMLQTLRRAFGSFVPQERLWHSDGRFFDPYRPTVEPNGFASAEEFEASQHSHYAAVRRVLEESDLFIFTLGLTEGWVSARDGAVFPLCPGTAAGQFDPSLHLMRNFGFVETMTDMRAFIEEARDINPNLHFLLTVSPIPLTATAGESHVLVATTYSKSVLRAVAGELAAQYPFVDYFPAYELVATHPIRAALYKPDLRNVAELGVDLVMRHFFAQHPGKEPADESPTPDTRSVIGMSEHPGDPICEEILLAEGR
jgi:hypothetical protein